MFICFVSPREGDESFPQHTQTHTHIQFQGADHTLIISPAAAAAAAYSNIHLMTGLQTFITCTHYTHTESFAFEELCDFLINFSKRNESLNQVLWLC